MGQLAETQELLAEAKRQVAETEAALVEEHRLRMIAVRLAVDFVQENGVGETREDHLRGQVDSVPAAKEQLERELEEKNARLRE